MQINRINNTPKIAFTAKVNLKIADDALQALTAMARCPKEILLDELEIAETVLAGQNRNGPMDFVLDLLPPGTYNSENLSIKYKKASEKNERTIVIKLRELFYKHSTGETVENMRQNLVTGIIQRVFRPSCKSSLDW